MYVRELEEKMKNLNDVILKHKIYDGVYNKKIKHGVNDDNFFSYLVDSIEWEEFDSIDYYDVYSSTPIKISQIKKPLRSKKFGNVVLYNGILFSLPYRVKLGRNVDYYPTKMDVIKIWKDKKSGYYRVTVRDINGKRHSIYLAKLLYSLYTGNDGFLDKWVSVRYKDMDYTNNTKENLISTSVNTIPNERLNYYDKLKNVDNVKVKKQIAEDLVDFIKNEFGEDFLGDMFVYAMAKYGTPTSSGNASE